MVGKIEKDFKKFIKYLNFLRNHIFSFKIREIDSQKMAYIQACIKPIRKLQYRIGLQRISKPLN